MPYAEHQRVKAMPGDCQFSSHI